MQELELCRDLRIRLGEITAQLQLPTESQAIEFKSPWIVPGDRLPPKRSRGSQDEAPEFPFVLVRPSSGQTGTDWMSKARVKIIIGCYSEEYDGHEYGLLVLAAIRRGLLENPTIGSVFRLELPLTWEGMDDQPYPEWQYMIDTEWSIATPLTTEPVDQIDDEGV